MNSETEDIQPAHGAGNSSPPPTASPDTQPQPEPELAVPFSFQNISNLAILRNEDLPPVNLFLANFKLCVIRNCDISRAHTISGCALEKCQLRDCVAITSCMLIDCQLVNCHLYDSTVFGGEMKGGFTMRCSTALLTSLDDSGEGEARSRPYYLWPLSLFEEQSGGGQSRGREKGQDGQSGQIGQGDRGDNSGQERGRGSDAAEGRAAFEAAGEGQGETFLVRGG